MKTQTDKLPKPLKREIELDFLRGIAILFVLDFHTAGFFFKPLLLLGWPHFGWIGVDFFFVLSGFLVGGLLMKEWKVIGRVDCGKFLIRRGFKIWPQYYFYLAIMLLTHHRTFYQLRGNLLNIQNYTGGVAHTWSLAVEEHAYLLLLFVFFLAGRFEARVRSIFFIVTSLAAVSIALCYLLSMLGRDVYNPTHTRLAGICFGVLLSMLYHFAPEFFIRLSGLRWLWLLLLAGALAFYRIPWHSWASEPTGILLADLSGVAMLLLIYRGRGKPRSAPYRFVAWIGLYSYGIYLWHVSVDEPLARIGRHLPYATAWLWNTLLMMIAGIILGMLMTRIIEFPMLRLRDRLFPRRIDSAVGPPAELEASQAANH